MRKDNNELLKIIGGNLRRIREDSKASIDDVAEALGYSTASVSNYELAKREVGIIYLLKFCKNFNVSYEDILDYKYEVKTVKKAVNHRELIK